MSNGALKVIVSLTLGLAPLAHAQDFDGTGDGGDIEVPPPPPTPPSRCVEYCGNGNVNPGYAAWAHQQAAQRAEQQREYDQRMYRQEVTRSNSIFQRAHEAESSHDFALAISLDEQKLAYDEQAHYADFDPTQDRANIDIDKANLAWSAGNHAVALDYMNHVDDGHIDAQNRRFIAYLQGQVEKQRETALAQQESTAFVAQRNTDLERQARENAEREDAMLAQRANAQLQDSAANGGKLPPHVEALMLSASPEASNAFGIKSNPAHLSIFARIEHVPAGGACRMSAKLRAGRRTEAACRQRHYRSSGLPVARRASPALHLQRCPCATKGATRGLRLQRQDGACQSAGIPVAKGRECDVFGNKRGGYDVERHAQRHQIAGCDLPENQRGGGKVRTTGVAALRCLTLTPEGLPMGVRGREVVIVDSHGYLKPLFRLPGDGMTLVPGNGDSLLLFGHEDNGTWGLYTIRPDRKVSFLLRSPKPITAAAETANHTLAVIDGALFRVEHGEMRLLAGEPKGTLTALAAHPDDKAIFVSDNHRVFGMSDGRLSVVTDGFGGTLRWQGERAAGVRSARATARQGGGRGVTGTVAAILYVHAVLEELGHDAT